MRDNRPSQGGSEDREGSGQLTARIFLNIFSHAATRAKRNSCLAFIREITDFSQHPYSTSKRSSKAKAKETIWDSLSRVSLDSLVASSRRRQNHAARASGNLFKLYIRSASLYTLSFNCPPRSVAARAPAQRARIRLIQTAGNIFPL